VLVSSDKAHVIQKAYELYKETSASLQDIVNYFRDNKIDVSVPRYIMTCLNMKSPNEVLGGYLGVM